MKKMQAGRRERRKQKTRNDLKRATEELLIADGYDALNIQRVTDQADLARATFYLHFGNVEEAVWAVLGDYFDRLVQTMWQNDEPDLAKRRFIKWVRLFEFVEENRLLMAVVLGENGHIKLVQRMLTFMSDMLESDLKSGRVARTTTAPISFEAQFYAGAVLNIIMWWLRTDSDYTPKQLADMLQEIVVRP